MCRRLIRKMNWKISESYIPTSPFETLAGDALAPVTNAHRQHSPGMSDQERELSQTLSFTCNFVFIAEMFWKVATYSWKKYIKSRWNQLDFFLVVISVIPQLSVFVARSPLISTWA